MTGDYGRGTEGRFERDRSDSEWARDPYRRTSRAGSSDWSDRSRHEDPQYRSWRQRHMNDLDRDRVIGELIEWIEQHMAPAQ